MTKLKGDEEPLAESLSGNESTTQAYLQGIHAQLRDLRMQSRLQRDDDLHSSSIFRASLENEDRF